MMIYMTGLVGFLLVLTAEAGVGKTTAGSLCTDTPECLLYDSVDRCQVGDFEFEIRRYDSVNWVSTSFSTLLKDWWLDLTALGPAFIRLKDFYYYYGIPMFGVTPGMVTIPEGKDSWMSKLLNTQEYSINFLLPSNHQSNPPNPTNKEVEILKTPEMYVFVRRFEGWLDKVDAQAQLLFKSLGMTKDFPAHQAVVYSGPPRPLDPNPKKYSEVWVITDKKPECPSSGK